MNREAKDPFFRQTSPSSSSSPGKTTPSLDLAASRLVNNLDALLRVAHIAPLLLFCYVRSILMLKTSTKSSSTNSDFFTRRHISRKTGSFIRTNSFMKLTVNILIPFPPGKFKAYFLLLFAKVFCYC